MSYTDQKGLFYLGREADLPSLTPTGEPLLYPSRHLTTHAVILGMTGSGKTGLGILLLEEALLQGIPVLAVDPKGDLTNLMLTFPELSPAQFEPWVDAERAQREGLSVEQMAAREAERWREGLSKWGIGPQRIARLREMVDLALYTPGSDAGMPVDVLHRFRPPDLSWETHGEVLRERIASLVTALLGLVGRETDPLQSSEHVFLAHLVEHAWRAGEELDLGRLIRLIQDPPIRQVGVFDLESFFPQKERRSLALALNNILAAPGFATWRAGVPLAVEDFLYTPRGHPRASIFYLPHLSEAERNFFLTLLLGAVREWMVAQPGTSDLRAILYFDELFGFFPPPPFNPPTKEPLLALVKQGRAAGLGLILSTQNPADLDYKGLTNAGTWMVGTLRTERDKERVLEGLEGAITTAGTPLKRSDVDRALGALKPRTFLLQDIHAGPPCFFHTRWAMSYLRGPLTRSQVRRLARGAVPAPPAPAAEPVAKGEPTSSPVPELLPAPPALPADVPQIFLPAGSGRREGRVHVPRLLALGTVYLVDERKGVRHEERIARLLDPAPPPAPVDWEVENAGVTADELSRQPVEQGVYRPLEPHMAKEANYRRWNKEFSEYLYRNIHLTLWHHPQLKLYGRVGESRRDFRVRCEEEVRSRRDEEIEEQHEKVERQMKRLETKLRREQRALEEDRVDLSARKREEMASTAESVFNLLSGRRSSSMLSTASRRRRMTRQAEADLEETEETIADLETQLEELKEAWEAQREAIASRWAELLEEIEEVEITPRRKDVVVDFCGLAWVPV